jgi:hypothetical protein
MTSRHHDTKISSYQLPTHTPWGAPDRAPERIADGIYFYTTRSHGGFWLSPERNLEVPTSLRALRFNQPDLNSGWYEEDCDWCLVALAHSDCFSDNEVLLAAHMYDARFKPRLAEIPEGWLIADAGTAREDEPAHQIVCHRCGHVEDIEAADLGQHCRVCTSRNVTVVLKLEG